jgi:hypothetical protein
LSRSEVGWWRDETNRVLHPSPTEAVIIPAQDNVALASARAERVSGAGSGAGERERLEKRMEIMLKAKLAICAFGIVCLTHGLAGGGLSHYRDFQLGGNLASVSALAGVAPSDAKVIHQRPAVLQDLEWRPSYWLSGSTRPQTDPVQQIVFSFYDDQLFRLVIDYDRQRTDGMTDRDMIEAISEEYGSSLKPKVQKTPALASQIEIESGTPIARWGDADYSVVLYRSLYGSGFRMIVASPTLDARARTAEAQSLRLEAREAPQREIARQKREADDAHASQEKARVTNKAAFRP